METMVVITVSPKTYGAHGRNNNNLGRLEHVLTLNTNNITSNTEAGVIIHFGLMEPGGPMTHS